MADNEYISQDDMRSMFASALSKMYRREVPQYGTLIELVSEINQRNGEGLDHNVRHRMEVERHGAIRLGTASELAMMRQLFSIMGMHPVGYYNLTVAGLPVHATCFRPLTKEALSRNPFRVFTSLLRLELVHDQSLREQAIEILHKRQIFTSRCIELIEKLGSCHLFPKRTAEEFLQEALETFRWNKTSTVDMSTYTALKTAHPLIADVVCFKGPHINHLTPRVLDIEAVQVEMRRRGLDPKEAIEGPPLMKCPILLRQTSFLALEEDIVFSDEAEGGGKHKARFGEIEQRGVALTVKGRHLYDELIERSRQSNGISLVECFRDFPDDLRTLREKKLAYFTYKLSATASKLTDTIDVDLLVHSGVLTYEPITYEDFLPVSAAGIFHSNLSANGTTSLAVSADQASFERGLGSTVNNEFDLYRAMEEASITECLKKLSLTT